MLEIFEQQHSTDPSESEKQSTIHGVLFGGLILSTLILGTLYSMCRQRSQSSGWMEQKNLELEQAMIELKESEHERQRLQREQVRREEVEFDIVPDLPDVHGDRRRLSEIRHSVLSNAVKFTANHRKVWIEVGCRRQGGEQVFYVRDNGIGINSRYHEKMFRGSVCLGCLRNDSRGRGL